MVARGSSCQEVFNFSNWPITLRPKLMEAPMEVLEIVPYGYTPLITIILLWIASIIVLHRRAGAFFVTKYKSNDTDPWKISQYNTHAHSRTHLYRHTQTHTNTYTHRHTHTHTHTRFFTHLSTLMRSLRTEFSALLQTSLQTHFGAWNWRMVNCPMTQSFPLSISLPPIDFTVHSPTHAV